MPPATATSDIVSAKIRAARIAAKTGSSSVAVAIALGEK